jgi:hypothetical protein
LRLGEIYRRALADFLRQSPVDETIQFSPAGESYQRALAGLLIEARLDPSRGTKDEVRTYELRGNSAADSKKPRLMAGL